MDINKLKSLVSNPNIHIHRFRKHTKASELYVDVTFDQLDTKFSWKGSIPFFYRRTGLFIEKEEELAKYLENIHPLFTEDLVHQWTESERRYWETNLSGKTVTKPFFDKLLNLRWNSVKYDLPPNPNWARRVQDIKELGYSLATDTKRKVRNRTETDTHILLVPLPRGGATGYETLSNESKKRIIEVLSYTNAFELSTANRSGLLPDHKFPEIRWDEHTREENPETMSDDEILSKFQLLDNQRNQQKREVCRRCFQTGKRGIIFGIEYFYKGDENWPDDIPKVGRDAEQGCVGCGWYDIQEWRRGINNVVQSLGNN